MYAWLDSQHEVFAFMHWMCIRYRNPSMKILCYDVWSSCISNCLTAQNVDSTMVNTLQTGYIPKHKLAIFMMS